MKFERGERTSSVLVRWGTYPNAIANCNCSALEIANVNYWRFASHLLATNCNYDCEIAIA